MRQTETYDFSPINRGDTFEEMILEFHNVDEDGTETPVEIASFCMQVKTHSAGKVIHDFQGEVFDTNKIRLFRHQVEIAPRSYLYDLEITETDGTVFTHLEGRFYVKQDISDGSNS